MFLQNIHLLDSGQNLDLNLTLPPTQSGALQDQTPDILPLLISVKPMDRAYSSSSFEFEFDHALFTFVWFN